MVTSSGVTSRKRKDTRAESWVGTASAASRRSGIRLTAGLGLHRGQQLAERPSHDPRDLHLGDPEPAADLVLVQVLLEPELEDAALALVELGVLGGELSLDRVVARLGLGRASR